MALKIRLRRMGRKKAPTYRIVVAESSMPRDGRFVDNIGHYNPRTDPVTLVVNRERALSWIAQGAMPTDTTRSLLKQAGVFKPQSEYEAMMAAAAETLTETAGKATKAARSAASGASKAARSAASGASKAAAKAKDVAGDAVEAVKDAVEDVVDAVEDVVEDVREAVGGADEEEAAEAPKKSKKAKASAGTEEPEESEASEESEKPKKETKARASEESAESDESEKPKKAPKAEKTAAE